MAPDGLLSIQDERGCDEQLSLTVIESPFSSAHQMRFAAPGSTIAELLDQLHLGQRYGETVLVTVDGAPVTQGRWAHVLPAEGSIVALRVIPQGGQKGKGILSIVIGIGLLVAAFAVGFGPLVFGSAALLPSGIAATTLGLVLGGALSIYAGVQSVLAPAPRQPFSGDIPQSNQSPALSGHLRNGFRPYAPVPEIFGRVLAVPSYAAKPYTEIIGSETFARLLFSFGIGPLTLTDLKIGDTLIDNFQGVETVIHPGWDDDPALSLFIDDVDAGDSFAVEFEPEGDGVWVEKTSTLDAHEGTVEISFPGGLLVFSDGGNLREVTIAFEVQFRVSGSADPWTDIDPTIGGTVPLPPGIAVDTAQDPDAFTMTAAEQGFIARGLRWVYTTAGLQYDVRMRRTGTTYGTSDPVEESKAQDMSWTALKTIRPLNGKPNVPNLCLVEMRILMTGQLGSLVDEFNAIAERHLKIWNSTDGWGPDGWDSGQSPMIIEKTRSHAAAIGHVLRATIADEYIDALGLEVWDTLLEGEGRTFDATVDFDGTVRSVAGDIAASARSAINVLDGKWGVVADRPQSDIVQLFTDRNSWDLESTRTFTKALHGMRVNFGPNEAAGWIGDQRIVYADGFDEGSADLDRLSEINLWGVVDKEIAFLEGRYHLASVALQPEVHTIQTDLEAIVCTRGDRVGLQSDVIKVSVSTGRLAFVLFDPAATLVSGTFDEEVVYEPAKAYGLTIRTNDMTLTTMPLVNLATNTKNFTLVTPHDFSGPPINPHIGDLFTFGELGLEFGDYLVKAIRYGDEITATLELVDYNAAIYTADTDPIPPWTPNISDPTPPQFKAPGVPTIASVLSDESVLLVNPDGTVVVRIEIGISAAQSNDIEPQFFQGQIRLCATPNSAFHGDWQNTPPIDIDQTKLYFGPLETGFTYEVRLRTISHDNRPSPFTTPLAHVVAGTAALPPDVENLRVQFRPAGADIGGILAAQAELLWDYPTPPRDLLGYEIRHHAGTSTEWSSAGPLVGPKAVSIARHVIDLVQSGLRTFLVKAVDRSGNESANAQSVQVTLGSGIDPNVVQTEAFAPVFNGTKLRCTVDTSPSPDELAADTNAGTFWTSDSAAFWLTDGADFWTGSFHDFIYTDSFAMSAGSLPAVLGFNITVTGNPWRMEYHVGAGDWLPWPGSIEAVDDTLNVRVLVEGGPVQGRITEFDAFLAAPDVVEEVPEFAVAASGTVTIPLVKTFRVIESVVLTAKSTTGVGVIGVYLNLTVTGPTVEVINTGGTRVVGTLSALVKGY